MRAFVPPGTLKLTIHEINIDNHDETAAAAFPTRNE